MGFNPFIMVLFLFGFSQNLLYFSARAKFVYLITTGLKPRPIDLFKIIFEINKIKNGLKPYPIDKLY